MSMSMNLVGTGIFAVIFIVAVIAQVSAKKFYPILYWATIITTTVGTTLADFADRSLGIGYAGGTTILFTLLMAPLFLWYRTLDTVAVDTVSSPKSEIFYWVIIIFSQTLDTALGDWTADTAGLRYIGGAVVGDFLDKPISKGGLELSRYSASAVLLMLIMSCIFIFSHKPVKQGH